MDYLQYGQWNPYNTKILNYLFQKKFKIKNHPLKVFLYNRVQHILGLKTFS